MAESRQRINGFAMAVVVEGGLALVALALAWLFNVPVRDMFPKSASPLLAAVFRGVGVALAMLVDFLLDGAFIAGRLARAATAS